MSCTAEDVPQDLWTQILQHVPWYQRLSACALVNQKLARAAPAATQSLDLDFEDSPTNHDAFLDWTMSHGGYLTRLYLHSVSSHSPIRQLPCPNLLELHLDEASVQLCASREHLGLLHSCTALTQLCLIYPTLLDGDVEGPAGAAPAAAARLQRFVLDADQPFTIQFAEANEHGKLWEALHDRLIPQLTSLTELAVGGRLQSCCTEHISTLVGLQKLFSKQGPITAATLPGIERLTALQDLSLYSCELEPSCLLPMTTGLTRLYLENLTLLPQLDGTLGTSQLLEVLEWLPALRVLGLVGIAGGWPQQQQELSAYSALTASTDLQELHIYDCNFPAAAWAHVFPAGLWLPHLHTFKGCRSDDRTAPGPSSFNSTAIQHLASCCPGLTDVHIDVYASVSLAPLPALLTALTRLRIGPVKPADIIWHLEPLSQLQDLSVSDMARYPGCWEDPSTNQYSLPLTALRNLTRLSYTLEVGSPDHEASITSKAPPGTSPDVWLQLLQHCARKVQLPISTTASMVQLLAQQATQIQEQQQQLVAAKAEAAELRGLVQSLLSEMPMNKNE